MHGFERGSHGDVYVTGATKAACRRTQSSPVVQEGHFQNRASPNQALVLIQHHCCVALDSSPNSSWHQDLFCASFRRLITQKGGLRLTPMHILGSYRTCGMVFLLQSHERGMKHGLLGFAKLHLNSETSWPWWESWEPQFPHLSYGDDNTGRLLRGWKRRQKVPST